MNVEKMREAIAACRSLFEAMDIPKIEYPLGELLDAPSNGLGHCRGMLDHMERFIDEGRPEKAFRWLCFIQGCLWMRGLATIDEFRLLNIEINR